MILVTGGTGLVGAHLLFHLLQENSSVRATRRASSNLNSVQQVFSYYTKDVDSLFMRIEWVEADIAEIPALTQAFEGITEVYHCAALISFNPNHYDALKKTNIEGTANMVNLCIAFKVEKLCYVSSIATIGHPLDHGLATENDPWNPEESHSDYSITKYGAEMEVWRGTQEGLKAVIVNPGVILGEGYWNSGSGQIVQKAHKGISFFTEGCTGFVDVLDVVNMMLTLMKKPLYNEKYILVGENLTYKELLSMLNEEFGHSAPSWKCPKQLLQLLSVFDSLSGFLFGSKRVLFKDTIRSVYHRSRYNAHKIQSELGCSFTPIHQTIKRVAKRFKG